MTTALLCLLVAGLPIKPVTPTDLVSRYDENSLGADREFKDKGVILVGAVEQVRDSFAGLSLVLHGEGERLDNSAHFEFDGSAKEQLAPLRRGQLVVVWGVGAGTLIGGGVLLRDGKLLWAAGDPTDDALLERFSLSATACTEFFLGDVVRTRAAPAGGAIKKAETATVQDELARMSKIVARARAELAAKKIEPIACDHRALCFVVFCDLASESPAGKIPECNSPFVRAVLAKMQAH